MDILAELGIAPINDGVYAGEKGWQHHSDAALLTSYNPSDNTALAQVRMADTEEYTKLILVAQQAAVTWRRVPAPQRGEVIRQIGQALRANKDKLGSLVALEMGKSKQEGDGEVQEMIDIADFAVGQSRMLYGKTMHSERPRHRMYEQWHPLGIVGVISAFNFPVAVWSWNAFIAAIAGNITVWKPSPKTPLCALAVQHICNTVLKACGYPNIFLLFISDDVTLSERFVSDTQISLISFTGSTEVGRRVASLVGGRLGRSLLELSGNNGIILDQSANLKLAIPAIVFGAVGTAGQRCTTTRRLFVHRTQYTDVVNKLTHAYQQLSIGDPLDERNHVGPLIDEQAVAAFCQTIQRVKALGGEILFGGERLARTGHFVQPTLVKTENHWDVVQQETFAPILYIIIYDDIEEAIRLHNEVGQGLSSALFSENLVHCERFLSPWGSDCGIANINIGTSGAEIGGAFGGEKDTGGGRESGSDAWKAYMRRQTNTINWGDGLPLAQGIQFKL